ncbi:MAG: ABC transporter ATP-binding protein, partial [Candidatus Bipolaricaulia bacterium]
MRLEAVALSYAYVHGKDVLRGVSLSVGDGEITFVLGANGSGKTTLLQCLGGLRHPTSGTVAIDGRPLPQWTARERAQRIGIVPQLHEPAFAFTVAEAVLMGRAPHLGLFARPGPADRAAADRALETVGVLGMRERSYTELSGGEQQLVLIARGLAQGARCLLMDEPAAHLDPRHQHGILGVVRELAGGGRSFVVTSHQPDN